MFDLCVFSSFCLHLLNDSFIIPGHIFKIQCVFACCKAVQTALSITLRLINVINWQELTHTWVYLRGPEGEWEQYGQYSCSFPQCQASEQEEHLNQIHI